MSNIKKSVLLDVERMKYPNSGLAEYCKNLAINLAIQKESNIELTFLAPQKIQNQFPKNQKLLSTKFFHRYFKVKSSQFDLWHATHQDTNYLPKNLKTSLLLTLHDLNFLQEKDLKKTDKRLRLLQDKIYAATAISTVSKYTLNKVQEYLKLEHKPSRVIYNGIKFPDISKATRPKILLKGPFLLYLGMVKPKKNVLSLIPLIERLKDYSLVIAGNNQDPYANEIRKLIAKHNLEKNVLMIGEVNDNEKSWLYQNCQAFLFPSLAEGFGMPVIEAMSLGKLVIAQNTTSLPEIAGPDISYFENSNPEHMEEVFKIALDTFQKNPSMSELWIKRAQNFSWEKSASQYLDFYQVLL